MIACFCGPLSPTSSSPRSAVANIAVAEGSGQSALQPAQNKGFGFKCRTSSQTWSPAARRGALRWYRRRGDSESPRNGHWVSACSRDKTRIQNAKLKTDDNYDPNIPRNPKPCNPQPCFNLKLKCRAIPAQAPQIHWRLRPDTNFKRHGTLILDRSWVLRRSLLGVFSCSGLLDSGLGCIACLVILEVYALVTRASHTRSHGGGFRVSRTELKIVVLALSVPMKSRQIWSKQRVWSRKSLCFVVATSEGKHCRSLTFWLVWPPGHAGCEASAYWDKSVCARGQRCWCYCCDGRGVGSCSGGLNCFPVLVLSRMYPTWWRCLYVVFIAIAENKKLLTFHTTWQWSLFGNETLNSWYCSCRLSCCW